MRKLLALLVILGFVLNVGCDTGKKPSTARPAPGVGKTTEDTSTDKGIPPSKAEDKKPEEKKPDAKKPEEKKPEEKKPEEKKPGGGAAGGAAPTKGNG